MKIALCFSGHIRDLELNSKYWNDLLSEHEVSVFGSFWDNYQNEENGDTIANFERLYSPIKYELESYSAFSESTLSVACKRVHVPTFSFNEGMMEVAGSFRLLPMFYKIWRSNMLSKTGEVYDLVIRARTDTHLDENFRIEKSDALTIPVGFFFMNRDNYPEYPSHSMGISDIFAYGPPDIMDYYGFAYLYVMSYFEQGYSLLCADHLLNVHLSKARILIDMVPHYSTITREWMGGESFIHNGWVTELYRNTYWSDETNIPLDPAITSFVNTNKISFER